MPDIVDPLEKAETRTLSLPRGDWEYLTQRGNETRSDRSKYVRALIARDRADLASPSAPDALSKTVLVELCKRLCGELDAGKLALLLNTPSAYDQPYLLQSMIHALLEFFDQGGNFIGEDEDHIRPRITSFHFQDILRIEVAGGQHESNRPSIDDSSRPLDDPDPIGIDEFMRGNRSPTANVPHNAAIHGGVSTHVRQADAGKPQDRAKEKKGEGATG